jgi:hypothetical protein
VLQLPSTHLPSIYLASTHLPSTHLVNPPAGAPAAAPTCPACLPAALPAEALSPEAVLQGVHLGAVDFLACPLSQQKLRNLWQHKIRRVGSCMRSNMDAAGRQTQLLDLTHLGIWIAFASALTAHPPTCPPGCLAALQMMQSSSEGCALPRPPSCPQLAATAAAGNNSSGAAARPLRHSISTPGFSCPTPPAVATAAGAAAAVCSAAPESSFSLGSFSLGSVSLGSGWGNCLAGTASAAAAVASDATSGAPHPQPAGSPPVLAPQSASLRAAAVAPGVAAPVAPRQWPALPSGTAWGTPVGFGMPPPALSQPAQAPPNSARPPLVSCTPALACLGLPALRRDVEGRCIDLWPCIGSTQKIVASTH